MARSTNAKKAPDNSPHTGGHIVDVESDGVNQQELRDGEIVEMHTDVEQQGSADNSIQVTGNNDNGDVDDRGADSPNDINVNNPSNYNHQCYICDKIFSANSNLNRHLRKIHKENVQSPYNNVKCALCESVFPSSCIYNDHLIKDHKVNIEIDKLTFGNRASFDEWKHGVEVETTSQFIKSRGEKRTKNVNKTYYSCNRSGCYVSKARTRKALKKQGSRKINGRCPASMNVTINPDSSIDVRFVKTHVGHDFELKHLDLSDKDRDLIVEKIRSGVTKKDIIRQLRLNFVVEQQQANSNATNSPNPSISPIDTKEHIILSGRSSPSREEAARVHHIELRPANSEILLANNLNNQSSTTPTTSSTSPTTPNPPTTTNNDDLNNSNTNSNCKKSRVNKQQVQPTSRLHLATTKDLHNILNSKRLDPKKISYNYDLNNFESWINEMKQCNDSGSSVLFYKSQNERSERFPKLRQDDFMLVIMNNEQSDLLTSHGDKCIVIDSTHNVHCEYLQVAYVSTVDEDRRSLPVAFMLSTRTDSDTLEVLFTLMKEKVGVITTRMFIADELHDFYQAWWRVMSMPVHNLLTPWSVFESWSKKFDLVKGREKLRKLKKQLRTLLTEAEVDKFTRSLKQILNDYKEDQDVIQFIEYFETNFSRNPDIWSSCLRKTHGVSNYQLWTAHDRFKSVYKSGKNSRKLCRFLYSLMNLYEGDQSSHSTSTRLAEYLEQDNN